MASMKASVTAALLCIILAALHVEAGATGIPMGSTGNSGSSATRNPVKSLSGDQQKNASEEEKEQKEANPQLYENYQQCYAMHISDAIGRPADEMDARKATIKKFCRGVTTAKNQKKFSECFNTRLGGSTDLDGLIKECRSQDELSSKK